MNNTIKTKDAVKPSSGNKSKRLHREQPQPAAEPVDASDLFPWPLPSHRSVMQVIVEAVGGVGSTYLLEPHACFHAAAANEHTVT